MPNLQIKDLVMPLFVIEGKNKKRPIKSMPGIYQFSADKAVKEAGSIYELGIPAILLFGVPSTKDKSASAAYQKHGIVQKTIAAIKQKVPGLRVITDVCLCSYTLSGHCHLKHPKQTLAALARMALSHVRAGADTVAPSARQQGQVRAIRKAVGKNVPILSYSAKFASNFYAPFREAANSAPCSGDRSGYQLDYKKAGAALNEIAKDIEQGADLVMVKPALAYLDIIRQAKEKFDVRIAAYNVSGEYAMVKAAAQRGWVEEKMGILEILTAIKRAGADIIITYYAKEIAKII